MKCPECGHKNQKDNQFCHECLTNLHGAVDQKRRKPMNEYERMKLGWYRSDKAWRENIQSRQIVKEGNKTKVVLTDGRGNIRREMPEPRSRW